MATARTTKPPRSGSRARRFGNGSRVSTNKEAAQPLARLLQFVHTNRTVRQTQEPFAALAERVPGNGHDVDPVEDRGGELVRSEVVPESDKREEPAARRLPVQTRNACDTRAQHFPSRPQLIVKPDRVVPVLPDGCVNGSL